MMRRLRLQWTSLPKRSPDDNPDETIFGDLQQKILDASDDPDVHATQGGLGGFAAICERGIADPMDS
jgi:hypothetical protein